MNALKIVPIVQILWLYVTNYRGKAISHDKGKADSGSDNRHVFDSMATGEAENGQPWHQSELATLVPLKYALAQKDGIYAEVTEEAIAAQLRAHTANPLDIATERAKLKFLACYGFCRRLDLGILSVNATSDISTWTLPAVVQELTAQQYVNEQVRENESKNIGAIKTKLSDVWRAYHRKQLVQPQACHSASQVQRYIGCTYGNGQRLYALLLAASLLPNGIDRMNMAVPSSTDDKLYSPDGYIPVDNLRKYQTVYGEGGICEDYRKLLDARGEASTPEAEAEIDKQIEAERLSIVPKLEKFSRSLVKNEKTPRLALDAKAMGELKKHSSSTTVGGAMARAMLDGSFGLWQAANAAYLDLTLAEAAKVCESIRAEAEDLTTDDPALLAVPTEADAIRSAKAVAKLEAEAAS